MQTIGKIKEIIVREGDMVISYTDEKYPNASGYQLLINKNELMSFPFVNERIEVFIDNTNTVRIVFVDYKLTLIRA